MKCFVTLSLLLTLFAVTIAQPEITRDDLIAPGDDIFFNYPENAPDPGPAGENVIWNFSAVVPDTGFLRLHVGHADTTPYSANFPTANISFFAEAGGVQVYQYHLVTNIAWQEIGGVTEGLNTRTYDNPKTQLQFPLTYNSQWQDDFSYTDDFVVSPVSIMGEGSVAGIVDGYGSLILPHATFNDVLRVKLIEQSMDTTDLGQGLSEKNVNYDTSFVWLSSSYHGPLCTYESSVQVRTVYLTTPDTVIVDSETNESSGFSYDPMSGSSGIHDEIQRGKFAVFISPNPFDRILNLKFTSDQSKEMQFIIRDLSGNIVFSESISAQSGENRFTLTLPELPSGAYIVLLQSLNGADVQKLIRIGSAR